ncbi:MAG: DUF2064 domain-containing protein, partial [Pseudomonadota bacterium]
WWYRHQCARLIKRVSDPRWETILAVAPDREGMESRVWPPGLPRWPQGKGDLGARMGRVMREAPPGPVLIIGSDVPGIRRREVWDAFCALRQADAVIGPAPDGGYWLIGLRRSPRRAPAGLFTTVRWSTEHALADTLRTLGTDRIARIAELRDVDTVEDLHAVRDAEGR